MQHGCTYFQGTRRALLGALSYPDSRGKVDGDKISFSAVPEIQGKSVKFNYTGTLTGDELKIRIAQADGGGDSLDVSTKRAGE